jgi:hypothetical protein
LSRALLCKAKKGTGEDNCYRAKRIAGLCGNLRHIMERGLSIRFAGARKRGGSPIRAPTRRIRATQSVSLIHIMSPFSVFDVKRTGQPNGPRVYNSLLE